MWQKASVSDQRGSMLPLFVGLVAVGLVLSLGAAQVCASFLYRGSMQETADQLSLISLKNKFQGEPEVSQFLSMLSTRYTLTKLRIADGRTLELELCGSWQGWLQLPGLDVRRLICVSSAAR